MSHGGRSARLPAQADAAKGRARELGHEAKHLEGHAPPIAAVLLLGFFAVVLLLMFRSLNLNQQQWDRSIYLLNGVEAIAFAAAGFLFGQEVNRQRANKAEQREDVARRRADRAKDKATRGEALAAIVKARGATRSQRTKPSGAFAPPNAAEARPPDAGDITYDDLAAVARELFPDP